MYTNISFHMISVKSDDVGPSTTLISYLRDKLQQKGTKYMCYEGGCGACVVAVEETINGKTSVFAVNAVSFSSPKKRNGA